MKKKVKLRLKFKVIFTIIVTTFTFIYTVKWLDKINFNIPNGVLKEFVVSSSNLNPENKVINNVVDYITKLDLTNPVNLININYKGLIKKKENSNKKEETIPVIKDTKTKKPLVYIYNTHQTEKYAPTNTELYNIEPDVITASYIFKENLRTKGIEALVEENSISEILKINNWNYASSYRASKILLEDAKKKNNTLEYFIDIHRDSVSKNITTTNINNKSYAKILFVIGLEHNSYKENLNEVERLNKILEKNYPGISRGIYKKSGSGVNGIYNQDFDKKTMLIEVGGYQNTLEEVANTIEALSICLDEFIGDRL